MKRSLALAAAGAVLLTAAGPARADEIPARYREVIHKGLEYLARTQQRDGHWDANGGTYPTTMTALAGTALLMEGSTVRDGRYAERIRKAVDWLMDRAQRNGLIGNPNNPSEAARYMYGHGYGMLFLAQAYGMERNEDRRRRMKRMNVTASRL